MKTRTAPIRPSVLRRALTVTWDLNIRAIPTSLVWAISLMFIFQSPSLLVRLVCSVICSFVSLFNCAILKFSYKHITPAQLLKAPQFQKIAALNVFVGILFVLSFSNLLNFQPAPIWISIVLKSSALTLLIGWIGLMLILDPLFVTKVATQEARSVTEIFILYVRSSKKEVLLSALVVVVCAPLIFFFISIVLTLTQAISVITSEALMEVEA
jgi:hypothetical protein